MNISLNPEAPLAQLYRQARALTSEETARLEEALALSEVSASAFADLVAQGGRGPGGWASPADRRRDQVRRAVIAALRHQALMARRAWMQQRESSAAGDPQVKALLQQATTLAEAALKLHREGDAGRNETEYVLHFLRATSAVAGAPAKKPLPVAPAEPQPAAAQPAEAEAAAAAPPAIAETPPPVAARPPVEMPPAAAAPAVAPPAPAPVQAVAPTRSAPAVLPDIVVVGPPPEPMPEKEIPRAARRRAADKSTSVPSLRPALVAALAVLALIAFAAAVLTAPRLLSNSQRPAKQKQPAVVVVPAASPQPRRAPVAAVAPAPSLAPKVAASSAGSAAGSQPAPRPTVRPTLQQTAAPATVELVLRSEPTGAQVYVDGTLKGTTPLRLEAPAGTVLPVTVRRGSRVWRGTLRLRQSGTQAITVRLPQPPPAVAQAPPKPAPTATPAPTIVNIRAHHEGLMAKGVELYRAGWYGPAMARFKQAIAVVPTPRAYLWLGRAAIRAGRYAEARRALEHVVALAPGTDAAREAQLLLNRLRLAERGT